MAETCVQNVPLIMHKETIMTYQFCPTFGHFSGIVMIILKLSIKYLSISSHQLYLSWRNYLHKIKTWNNYASGQSSQIVCSIRTALNDDSDNDD